MLKAKSIESCLSFPLKFAMTPDDHLRALEFRKESYKKIYPSVNFKKSDPYIDQTYTIYTDNSQKDVDSTASCILDSKRGLPEDKLFPSAVNDYRKSGKKLMEVGRFVIGGRQNLLKHYYKAFYDIGVRENIDVAIIVIRRKDIPFHKNLIGVDVLSEDIGETFGSKFAFACAAWDIVGTKPRFKRWVASI